MTPTLRRLALVLVPALLLAAACGRDGSPASGGEKVNSPFRKAG